MRAAASRTSSGERLAVAGTSFRAALENARLRRSLLAAGALAVFLALAFPLLLASPAPLTSDESLYLSEAYNIATGRGATYASGELIHHRAPLYPALLAVPVKLTGSADSAYVVTKLIILALCGATFLLARQAFGTAAGVIAALLMLSSSYLRWLGATLFLDGLETLFLLLYLYALLRAFEMRAPGWFVAAALLFCGAFLTKESSILWLPLPLVFALVSRRLDRSTAIGLGAHAIVVLAVLGGWWAWVFAVTGRVYLLGTIDTALIVAAGAASACVALVATALRFGATRYVWVPPLVGTALAAGWGIGLLVTLELTSWPFDRAYWSTVPEYLGDVVAPNSQPWPLLLGGVVWLCWHVRRHDAPRLLVLALALFLPFGVFVANRSLAYRDLLPLLVVVYVAAGGFAAATVGWANDRIGVAGPALAGAGLIVFGIAQTGHLVNERLDHDPSAVTIGNWDNPLAHDTAAWLHDNVPPETAVMASRLYFSQIYVLDEAAHPIHQLPTVRVEPVSGEHPRLRAVSTLFRWEDQRLVSRDDERWLYVQRYPHKDYYIALSENDLLRQLGQREAGYLLLTGEDMTFSSLSYVDYFLEHPAFELVHRDVRDKSNGAYVFRVDRAQLAPREYRAAITAETLDELAGDFGLARDGAARAIDGDGVWIR
jgi:4-amino-4-deoxy-L-arabinose transferase-like glycosyltransferase